MCNLYSATTNQAAIQALFRVVNRYLGNPSAMPSVFPNDPAPVVRNGNSGERELAMMRWSMPPPSRFGRPAGDERAQHHLAALARLAETGEPLPGTCEQHFRVRSGAEPCDQ
ncbi:putative SOS response-associated peptidase YedK [Bradyrhizobium japonicum]